MRCLAQGELSAGAVATNLSAPYEIQAGCEYEVLLLPAKPPLVDGAAGANSTGFDYEAADVFLRLERPAGTRLGLEWSWRDAEQTLEALPAVLFGWGAPPTLATPQRAAYYDFYRWPSEDEGRQEWHADIAGTGRDVYHLAPGAVCHQASTEPTGLRSDCSAFLASEREGTLYVTVTSNDVRQGQEARGTLRITVEEVEATTVLPEQNRALRSLHERCCAPRKAPPGWSWEFHALTVNIDLRQKPYCDWLGSGDWPGGDGEAAVACDALTGVGCDAAGNVVHLSLAGRGLQCELGSEELAVMPLLRTLDLRSNQLSGAIAENALVAMDELETLDLSRNSFDGDAPCLSGAALRELVLSHNRLTGSVYECYATAPPRLRSLELANNRLSGELPELRWPVATIPSGTLLALDFSDNFFGGQIPAAWSANFGLQVIDASRNALQGELPLFLMSAALPALYALRLSDNALSGPIPEVQPGALSLRIVELGHNEFSGSISEGQFAVMQDNIRAGLTSSLQLDSAGLSGDLPRGVYNLVFGPRNPITYLSLMGNFFRCDEDTDTWPQWALDMAVNKHLGTCTKVPSTDRAVPDAGAPGDELLIIGDGFKADGHLNVRFTAADGSVVAHAPGLYMDRTSIAVRLPATLVGSALKGSAVTVAVANFGSDFTADAGKARASFELRCAAGTDGPRCEFSDAETCGGDGVATFDGGCRRQAPILPRWGVPVIAGVLLALAGALGTLIYLVRRERKGRPVFVPLETFPMMDVDGRGDNGAAGGGDAEAHNEELRSESRRRASGEAAFMRTNAAAVDDFEGDVRLNVEHRDAAMGDVELAAVVPHAI